MIKYIYPLALIICFSCQSNQTETEDQKVWEDHFNLEDYIVIQVYPYEHEGEMKASAMPELQLDSNLMGMKKGLNTFL